MVSIRQLIAPRSTAHAHCDIPCGIYDPAGAKTAADTVAKMVEKINAIPKDSMDLASRNSFVRMVGVAMRRQDMREFPAFG